MLAVEQRAGGIAEYPKAARQLVVTRQRAA
jgi:hypothetical protein